MNNELPKELLEWYEEKNKPKPVKTNSELSEKKRKRLEEGISIAGESSRKCLSLSPNALPEITPFDYSYFFKLDEWIEDQIIDLFDQKNPEKLRDLIRASINAKKLHSIRWQQSHNHFNSITYYFDPAVIIDWAISKQIELPKELLEWYEEKNKLKPEQEPDYLNPSHLVDSKADRPLATRQRKTFLIIIAALCSSAKIDPEARGASQRIKELTESLGVPVDDETIRNLLSEIPDALEARMK